RKQCPEHGLIEEFVCSDVRYYDRHELDEPAKEVRGHSTDAQKGCPYDCGLCPEHEQHTCVGLAEITSACNLECPMCFAASGPGGRHWTFEEYTSVVDRFIRQEHEVDVLQLSGGEPTIHPEIVRMTRYAYERPIQVVMINTNGIRLAQDPALVKALAPMRDRLEIYLQFDGFSDRTYRELRGESLTALKLRALDLLAEHGIRSTLVCTVQHGVNLDEVGAIVKFGLERPWVRGASFQPATYVGRHVNPKDLENRVTIPDVVKAIVGQTEGIFVEEDFLPVPCAHPNCHMMTYVYRGEGRPVPVSRFLDIRKNTDLVANTLVYTPAKAKAIVSAFLDRQRGCCDPAGAKFVESALAEKLTGAEVFRITLTAFLDRHIFDVRRVMKCCIGFLLPSGHTVPFCAYNTLYRDGTVPLPPLKA
ncbi:MAG TPA: radical SAM protein, partial [Planctomycetota bacterium]|nr:radical SAM protein [Planctomycetota bacterium]